MLSARSTCPGLGAVTLSSVQVRSTASSRLSRSPAVPADLPGYTADPSVGLTYRYQRALPHLPVPSLASTATKYLDSIRPLVSPQQPGTPTASDAHPTPEYLATKAAVEDFLKDPVVKQLQERLEARANDEGRESWLSDWWNKAAYFGYRDPLVPYVSYFYLHKDSKTHRTGPSRAAALIRALLFFRRMTENQQLEPEMAKKLPLCMASYKWLFNACRYPEQPLDTARKFDPAMHEHIVVARLGHFYEVSIKRLDGEWLSVEELESQFTQIITHASALGPNPHPIGTLTVDNRDRWASARVELVKDPTNAAALERVESAIIVVALDNNKPVTREESSWNLWCGDGKNRFFDKHQLIVSDNGRSGFLGEHSCMDGTPTSRLNDWMLRSLFASKIDLGTPSSSLPPPKPLIFNISPSTQQSISTALSDHQALMSRHSLSVLHYEGYGKRVIKQFKTSPDSWAQLVMQFAHYKLTGELAPTYESAQTRKFKLGRTEVIRSATAEALEWCKAMEDPKVGNAERLEKFQKAVKAHGKYAAWAADAQGVDRHLFGLKKLLKEGEPLPKLYQDPSYAKSSNWVLSTSQLASEFFEGWGYGEVVSEGYGLAYAVNNDSLRFTITTLTGNAEKLRHYLAEAATEVRECNALGAKEADAPEKDVKPKL